MRLLSYASFLLLVSGLAACGNAETDTPPELGAPVMTSSAQVGASAEVELPDPIHGGSVVVVDSHPVEVVVAKNGVVQAYPFGDGIDIESSVVARVSTPAGVQPVTLVWNPEVECFVGRIESRPVAGPVVLEVSGEGRVYEARAPHVVLAPPSTIVVSPTPAVVVEAPRPAVVAPAPEVVVEQPAGVVVAAPPPVVVAAPRVHVRAPAPPSVHVELGAPVYVEGRHVHGKVKRGKIKHRRVMHGKVKRMKVKRMKVKGHGRGHGRWH